MTHLIYLHGFGSGPGSCKALGLAARLAPLAASWQAPALDGGDFTGSTFHSLAERAVATLAGLPGDGRPAVVIGSSLGGYLAAWLAAQHRLPRLVGLVLLAPAFGFTARFRDLLGPEGLAAWRRDGVRSFFHQASGSEQPLGVAFLDSCADLPELPPPPPVPTILVQGLEDETVDWRLGLEYACRSANVSLHLIHAPHALAEPDQMDLVAGAVRRLQGSTEP